MTAAQVRAVEDLIAKRRLDPDQGSRPALTPEQRASMAEAAAITARLKKLRRVRPVPQ